MYTRIENNLSEAITDYAQLKKKTVSEVKDYICRHMGWSQNKLSYLCNNTVQPKFEDTYRLSQILQVSTDRLFREVTITVKSEI